MDPPISNLRLRCTEVGMIRVIGVLRGAAKYITHSKSKLPNLRKIILAPPPCQILATTLRVVARI